jgi:DMSO/TMAO reductase YedYZ molybdopterin-dependent catalytic subunit
MDIISQDPLNAEPTWEDLRSPITVNFFKRNHYAFPQIKHQLDLCGRIFGLEELRFMPTSRQEVTLECAGNGRAAMDPRPPGTAWGWKGVSNGVWSGVRLSHLLAQVELPRGAKELVFQGGDDQAYARSLPLEYCQRPEILVVHSLNDQPLPLAHGGPLRLLVPGYYAMASVKWLTQVRAVRSPFRGYYQVEDYQFKPSQGPGRPVSRMLPRALPVSPQSGQQVRGPVEVEGWAWSGTGTVVEVALEVGSQRVLAQLGEVRGEWAWRSFTARLDLPPGRHRILALARDGSGVQQPVLAPWNEAGYENNSAMPLEVEVLAP